MTPQAPSQPSLTTAQKKILRSHGHGLRPLVQIGKEGLSPTLVASTVAALKSHELVKAKVGKNAPVACRETGTELARLSASLLLARIGRVFLLYRPNPELPPEKQLLPSGAAPPLQTNGVRRR